MLSIGTRASLAIAGACLVFGNSLPAQSINQDPSPRAPRFTRDTLFQSTVIAHRVIQVRAELDTTPVAPVRGRRPAPRLTGRYTVHAIYPNRERLIAARLEPASDAPTIAFISHGDPAVIVLSTYLGGTGRTRAPNHSFKVLVAEAEQFRVFTVQPDSGAAIETPDIKSFDRGPEGSFTLRFADGPSVRYRDRRLSLVTSAAQR